jgi:hypothetical protein
LDEVFQVMGLLKIGNGFTQARCTGLLVGKWSGGNGENIHKILS